MKIKVTKDIPFEEDFATRKLEIISPDEIELGRMAFVGRYESEDGINFKNTGKIVNRAMRPNINYINGKYYLF